MRNLLFIAVLFSSLSALAQKKELLSLNLEIGKAYKQVSHARMQMRQVIDNEKVHSVTTFGGTTSFKVIEERDGIYKLETTMEQLQVEVRIADSLVLAANTGDDTVSNIFDQILSNIIGRSFVVFMQRNGHIEDVKDMYNVYVNAFKGMLVSQEQRVALLQQVQQMYGEEAMKSNMETSFAIFPDKKVSVKDQWQKEVPIKTVIEGRSNMLYTLTEKDDRQVTITSLSTMETDARDALAKVGGMYARYDLIGQTRGKYTLDPQSGWITSMNSIMEMSGNIYLREFETSATETTMPIQYHIEVTGSDK